MFNHPARTIWLIILINLTANLTVLLTGVAYAQDIPVDKPAGNSEKASDPRPAPVHTKPAAVVYEGTTLFEIRKPSGTKSPEQRAETIEAKLLKLKEDPKFRARSITVVEGDNNTEIVSGHYKILTITDDDAKAADSDRDELAEQYAKNLRAAMKKEETSRAASTLRASLEYSGLSTLALVCAILLVRGFANRLLKFLEAGRGKFIRTIKIQNSEIMHEDTIYGIAQGLTRLTRTVVILCLIFTWLTTVLAFFPATEPFSEDLRDQVVDIFIKGIGKSILQYIPNLFFIVIIGIITRYLLKFLRFLAKEIESGTLQIPGFETEWANPTLNIFRFLVVVFAVMLSFPYLPGSGSQAFQQISIFLGVLFSLGSTGAVSNIVAGVFLTYTGAFKINDRVKIADTVGDVVGRSLLATRVKTIKQEYITIPNSLVLGSHIVNYSSSQADPGLVLHSTVTIGYDINWRKVHELLIDAAKRTRDILQEPEPFVLQTGLNDYYVSYQLNAYTTNPTQMALIYSDLHQHIQDNFAEAKIEILSPHYRVVRETMEQALPPEE